MFSNASGLPRDQGFYPVVSSTSAGSGFRLVGAYSFGSSLASACVGVLSQCGVGYADLEGGDIGGGVGFARGTVHHLLAALRDRERRRKRTGRAREEEREEVFDFKSFNAGKMRAKCGRRPPSYESKRGEGRKRQ